MSGDGADSVVETFIDKKRGASGRERKSETQKPYEGEMTGEGFLHGLKLPDGTRKSVQQDKESV